jgi:Cu+-exporting ATPase
MAVDPVCQMEIDETSAEFTSKQKGEKYYFCSAECKEAFDDSPEEYIVAA